MINYVIIDDETIAHDIIKGYCEMLPNFYLGKHCYDAIDALDYLSNHKVDVVFLDLNMPKLKGFEFLKILSHPPHVIVTTAYKEFAIEGYALNVVDYLLKPFSFERFIQAIHKLPPLSKTRDTNVIKSNQDTLFLKSNRKVHQVKLIDVLWVEATGNYLKVMTINDMILVREKLSDLLQKLPRPMFIQVHKSFIVAKSHIAVIEGNRISIGKSHIPVGKTYKINLRSMLS